MEIVGCVVGVVGLVLSIYVARRVFADPFQHLREFDEEYWERRRQRLIAEAWYQNIPGRLALWSQAKADLARAKGGVS